MYARTWDGWASCARRYFNQCLCGDHDQTHYFSAILFSGLIALPPIMHEMGIAIEVIKIATASIPVDAPHARVARVNLSIGKLAAVIPDSLRFCFGMAARDTPLAGAELIIEEIPVRIRCQDCHATRTVAKPVFQCQKCGSDSVTVISGQELDIRSIEIEADDPE